MEFFKKKAFDPTDPVREMRYREAQEKAEKAKGTFDDVRSKPDVDRDTLKKAMDDKYESEKIVRKMQESVDRGNIENIKEYEKRREDVLKEIQDLLRFRSEKILIIPVPSDQIRPTIEKWSDQDGDHSFLTTEDEAVYKKISKEVFPRI